MKLCYPDTTDWSCAYTDDEIAALDPKAKERSEALAWSTLASLSGYQIATCPILVRPCAERCQSGSYLEAPVTGGLGWARPGINAQGYWVNSCGCGAGTSCSCTTLSEVILPGPVGDVVEVRIDGAVVDPSEYRVDQGNRLVALGDRVWPACQDMSKAAALSYDPVTIDTPGAVFTFVRTGNIVEVDAIPTGVAGANTFTVPWLPTTTVQVTGVGGPVFIIQLNGATGGGWSPGQAPLSFSYEALPDPDGLDLFGTFSVEYWRGFPPNSLTNFAAGTLAVEFYKACTNAKGCRLPSGVTQVTRQGVSMEIQTGMFSNGYTGIREVDAVIAVYNPNGLRQPATVTSPDTVGARTPTWRW